MSMDPGYSQPSPWGGNDPGYSQPSPWGSNVDPGYDMSGGRYADLVADHVTVSQEVADQQARASNIAQLGGRVGRSIHRLRTTGIGNGKQLVRIDFSLTFAEQPTLATGVEMTSTQLDMAMLPLATVGVYRWIIDGRGLWTGAHVWVAVGLGQDSGPHYLNASSTARGYVLQHHLTFEGMAIRDVSYDAIYDD